MLSGALKAVPVLYNGIIHLTPFVSALLSDSGIGVPDSALLIFPISPNTTVNGLSLVMVMSCFALHGPVAKPFFAMHAQL